MTTKHQAPEVTSEMARIIERLCRKQQVYNGRNTFRDEFVNPDGPEIAKLLARATQPQSLTIDDGAVARLQGLLSDERALDPMTTYTVNGDDLRALLDRLQSLSQPVGEASRFHFTDERPFPVETIEGTVMLGKGWLAITEDEYRELNTLAAPKHGEVG